MPSPTEITAARLQRLIGLPDAPPIVDVRTEEDFALAPEVPGLLAVSPGLSRMHRDDLAQLEAALPPCDALDRWCRDATAETHGPAVG